MGSAPDLETVMWMWPDGHPLRELSDRTEGNELSLLTLAEAHYPELTELVKALIEVRQVANSRRSALNACLDRMPVLLWESEDRQFWEGDVKPIWTRSLKPLWEADSHGIEAEANADEWEWNVARAREREIEELEGQEGELEDSLFSWRSSLLSMMGDPHDGSDRVEEADRILTQMGEAQVALARIRMDLETLRNSSP